MSGGRTWFRSTDGGRTWRPIELNPRSLVANLALPPGEVYDDGFGNRYRCEVNTEGGAA